MNNFSKLLTTISSTVLILLVINNSSFAQGELDKIPSPKGGVNAITQYIVYPQSAKENGIQGKVFIEATIDEMGKVVKTEVKRSVNTALDAAAVQAIMMTAFNPGEKDGKKVKATVTIPIQFKLDNCKEEQNGTEKKS
jgi:TonB family protein